MKKILSMILIFATVFVLVACGGETPPVKDEQDSLFEFRERLAYSYNSVIISVKTEYGGITLNDRYSITYLGDSIMIDYQKER